MVAGGVVPMRPVLRRRRVPETPAGQSGQAAQTGDKLRSGICRLTGLERSGEVTVGVDLGVHSQTLLSRQDHGETHRG